MEYNTLIPELIVSDIEKAYASVKKGNHYRGTVAPSGRFLFFFYLAISLERTSVSVLEPELKLGK